MNVGYAATAVLVTVAMLVSFRPLARSGRLGIVSWLLSDLVNESPFLGMSYLLLSTVPALVSRGFLAVDVAPWFLLGCASFAVTPALISRSMAARATLQRALDESLADEWRTIPGPAAWRRRLPLHRIVLAPLPIFAMGVRRRRGLRYGPARRHRLDIYRGHGNATSRPVLIHLHGGGFRTGRKSFYARALLHTFARHGWICVSASHRLRPASYADMLADTKRIVAWTHQHIADDGGDPHKIVLAGSSSGAHLAITAALSATRASAPANEANSSVCAAIGLYGYYGPVDHDGPPSQPAAYVHPDAPPMFIIHGAQDTFVPPGAARHLAQTVRGVSAQPVLYAELPGAQHSFDLLHSVRFHLVIDALWNFTVWVMSRQPAGRETQ